jgi:predicted component of type VI protein secretion system
VRRAGSAVATPLALLQPAVLPLTAQVVWPDGHPRRLTDVIFRVDGVAQPLATTPALDDAGQLPLSWDISERDAGTYRLEVEVADELGFRAASAPLEVVIEIARPSPPSPTVTPTRAPSPLATAAEGVPWAVILPAALLAAGGVATGVALLRRRRARRAAAPPPAPPRIIPAAGPPDDRHVAVLEWATGADADPIELTAADVTLGREAEAVEIILEDPSVSRLHARIRRNQAGEYWLFDEGSESGTFLNHERLGLAPRQLQHNDLIQLGRVTLRFRLELAGGREQGSRGEREQG